MVSENNMTIEEMKKIRDDYTAQIEAMEKREKEAKEKKLAAEKTARKEHIDNSFKELVNEIITYKNDYGRYDLADDVIDNLLNAMFNNNTNKCECTSASNPLYWMHNFLF